MRSEPVASRPALTVVRALLECAQLPADDLRDGHMAHFFFIGSPSEPEGVVGVELCGQHALLRSLVVVSGRRTSGLGTRLVEHAEAHARAEGAHDIYLLTTTAEAFFRRRGYRTAQRVDAPPEIRRTREFADICPASSAFLTKTL
jgi:amino-acid N-acetyltransferase